MEIEINSNDHKISNNKLQYYFNDITKFEKQCSFINGMYLLFIF